MKKYNYLTEANIHKFIENALEEDVQEGDHSSLASVPSTAQRNAKLIIKGEGLIAGIELARYIFEYIDKDLEIEYLVEDGQSVQHGDIGLYVAGQAQAILKAERLVLNCMQRMSGIATLTHRLQTKVSHTKAKILDTRKTTPNFRLPEKWAVKIGGGENHRYGLFDMIMLKDNHIAYSGSIRNAIENTKQYLEKTKKQLAIEIETQSLEEVKKVMEVGGVDVIMLDNMSVEDMTKAVALVAGEYVLEASGGITSKTIEAVAETGVDFISVGALTHSVESMDISLKAV